MRYFLFDGIDSRTYGFLLSFERPLFAEVIPNTIKVPKRAGVYVPQNKYSSREQAALTFRVRFGILGDNQKDFRDKARSFAAWLYEANLNGEAKRLWISDEPEKAYMAYIEGGSDLNEIQTTGEAYFNFLVPDPFAFAVNDTTVQLPIVNQNKLNNTGMFEENWQIFYNNMISERIFYGHEPALKLTMTDPEANIRSRIVSNAETDVNLIAGETYTLSFVIDSSLKDGGRIGYTGLYYHETATSAAANQWFTNRTFTEMPLYDKEGSRLYVETFQALETTRARLNIGMHDTTPLAINDWFSVRNVKIELGTERTLYRQQSSDRVYGSSIDYAGSAATYPIYEVMPLQRATDIEIINNGEKIRLEGEFAANEKIIFDTAEASVYNDRTKENLLRNLTIESNFKEIAPEDLRTDITISANTNMVASFLDGWDLNANATAIDPFVLELNATGNGQFSRSTVSVTPNAVYYLTGEIQGDARVRVSVNDSTSIQGGTWITDFTGDEMTFTVPDGVTEIVLAFGQNANVGAGYYKLSYPFMKPQEYERTIEANVIYKERYV